MQQDSSSFWTDIKAFEDQLAKSPDSYCFAKLSEVYLKVGLVDDALHTAREGVARHPGYLGGLRSLAMACEAKGLDQECLATLKLVTAAMPEDHHAQKLFGRLLLNAGDLEGARRAYQTVLEFVPDDVESQMELNSLVFSSDSEQPLPLEADEEEIIEDLEILEELDVLEEDQQDSDFAVQEQQTISVQPTEEILSDPLNTVTLAELHVKQGFIDKAIEIYRSILAGDPDNHQISGRIAELERPGLISTEPELPGEEVFSFEPDSLAVSEPPFPEEVQFVAPVEEVGVAGTPQGKADTALSTLKGWLENIRRIKS